MHIVIISDSESEGGAAIAASRLAEALANNGQTVTRIVFQADFKEHLWKTIFIKLFPLEKYFLMPFSVIPFNFVRSIRTNLVSQHISNFFLDYPPDIINVQNIHGAVWSPDLLRFCSKYAPTVWTLHDTWSFTGRCAYFYDCNNFLDGCDSSCPTSKEYPSLPSRCIKGSWKERKRLFSDCKGLVGVSPSQWLAKNAASGFWKGHRLEVIPNGLPLDIYKPVDSKLARMALGVDANGPIILAAAQNLNDRRKGGDLLVPALKKVTTRPLTLITFGNGLLPANINGIIVNQLGYVNPERIKILAYNAADLLVHPAPVDNLPNVVMESIACGTPVVGFQTGGVPELVRPGKTGWLAKDLSCDALAKTIDLALTEILNGTSLRKTCSDAATAEYSSQLQAGRYLDLFRSMKF